MIVVNSSTRQFNIPGADIVFGVTADSGSEVKYFQCPRYVGNNLDIAGSFVRMNYRNANGEIDSYLVKDVAVDGDNVTFSWELSPKVTMYKGQVSFVMCVVGADTKVKWHTTLGRGQVLEGMEPDADMVEDGTADVVTALIAMVDAQTTAVENAGETQVRAVKTEGATQVQSVKTAAETAQTEAIAEIEAKKANSLAEIPDDYTALSEAVDTLNRTRGSAIICEAEGETIIVEDASDLPMQGLRVFGKTTQATTTGKNLWNNEAAINGAPGLITITDTGFSFVRGTSTLGTYISCKVPLHSGETITWSCTGSKYAPTLVVYSDNVYGTQLFSGIGKVTYTPTEDMENAVFAVIINSSDGDNVVSNIQAELGGTATEYEPYSGGQPSPSPEYPQELVSLEPMVGVYGSNFANSFGIEKGANSSVVVSEDGHTISCIGGADKPYTSSPIYLPMEMLRGKTVILKADSITNSLDSSGKGGNVQLNIRDSQKMRYVAISPKNLVATTTIPEDVTRVDLNIYTNNSAELFETENTTVIEGLRLSLVDCEWETYKEPQTVELTHTLPGIPVTSGGNYTDSDGQQWICDEVDFERGVYVQRVAVVDLATVTKWLYQEGWTNETAFYAPLVDKHPYISYFDVADMYCTRLPISTPNSISATKKNGIGLGGNGGSVYVCVEGVGSVDELTAYFAENETVICYPVTTPIETALSETELAAYAALHSNKPNTTILNDSGAHMAVAYAADTKLYIDNKIAALVSGK